MIITKWAYLANRCHEANYPKAEDLAKEIDSLLEKLGFGGTTKKWDDEFAYIDDYSTDYIVASTEYCTACQNSDSYRTCDFRMDGTRLVHEFYELIEGMGKDYDK